MGAPPSFESVSFITNKVGVQHDFDNPGPPTLEHAPRAGQRPRLRRPRHVASRRGKSHARGSACRL